MKTIALIILAYCLVTLIAFGDILAPVAVLVLWPDRLGALPWNSLALGSAVLSTGIFLAPLKRLYKLPAFVLLTMAISIVSIGLYADHVRHARIAAFAPDAIVDHSFFRSIRESPREFQFFLHAGAVKNCVPYGWSYRRLDFYELPANVAVNVLPREWIERCEIHRT